MSGGMPGHDGSHPVDAYKVDVSKGEMRGEVSAQWASRPSDQKFDTLSELYDFKKALWDRAHDVYLRSADVTAIHPDLDFDENGMTQGQVQAEVNRRMGMMALAYKDPHGGDVQRIVEAAPTHLAFSHLCSYADLRQSEVRKFPTKIASEMLNWRLKYGGVRADECKLWADIPGSAEANAMQVHAMQGPNYGRISDHEVVAAVMGLAGDGKGDDPRYHWKAPGRLNWSDGTYDPEAIGPASDRTFYGSDRDVFMFLVDDRRPIVVGTTRDGNPDLMFRGFYVQNSMVGERTLKVGVFYLRGVCMNRNLWGVEKFNEVVVRHTRGAPERWLQECKPALEGFAHGTDRDLIEGVERAKAKVLVEQEKDAVAFLRKSVGFGEAASRAIVEIGEREEGRKPRTVWDFGQAITAYARTARNTDDRLDIETAAKKIFDKVA